MSLHLSHRFGHEEPPEVACKHRCGWPAEHNCSICDEPLCEDHALHCRDEDCDQVYCFEHADMCLHDGGYCVGCLNEYQRQELEFWAGRTAG